MQIPLQMCCLEVRDMQFTKINSITDISTTKTGFLRKVNLLNLVQIAQLRLLKQLFDPRLFLDQQC